MGASSASTGFFQQLPILKNQYDDDFSIQRVLRLFVPEQIASELSPEIAQLADKVLDPQVLDWITDSERNLPYISGGGKNAFGESTGTKLVCSEGWRKLQELGHEIGNVAQGYETGLDQYTRVVQYLRGLLWEASSSNTTCPNAMQDGAARVLQLHLASKDLDPVRRKVFQNAFDHLTSRDPKKAWTSGQWMTERTGGSDVSLTETVATYSPLPDGAPLCNPDEGIPLGPWSISGFKWFSSATDSNMTLLLAKTPRGLSAFLAPLRRHNPNLVVTATGTRGGTELNGVTISRMKNKMGTKSLPTAELELRDMRGWLVGEEGRGIQEIANVLTITRVRSALAGLGYVSRGLAIARAFALVREVGSGRGRRQRLCDSPLHLRTLADMTAEYHSMMLLTFYSAWIMGLDEHPATSKSTRPGPNRAIAQITPPPQLIGGLLRVLTPLLKAYCTKSAVPLLYACMESLGGVGVMENSETEYMNVARLFRDACVLNIWEGTTDVLSTDLLRALKHPRGGKESIEALDFVIWAVRNGTITKEWEQVRSKLASASQDELVSEARDILWKIAEILMAVLLIAETEHDRTAETREVCERYLVKKGFGSKSAPTESQVELRTNQTIVYGPNSQNLVGPSKL